MRISFTPIKYGNSYRQVNFNGVQELQTLAHTNIGKCSDGYIGKIRVRKSDNHSEKLSVYKKHFYDGSECYFVKDFAEELVGKINLTIRKFSKNNKNDCAATSNHVFVSELMNYSNPSTPYYKQGLKHYKDIGLRLMQIAQRRSEESLCDGNVRLIAKNEAKDWYKTVIGMSEENQKEINTAYQSLGFNIYNPNKMFLPENSKERLSKLHGGL